MSPGKPTGPHTLSSLIPQGPPHPETYLYPMVLMMNEYSNGLLEAKGAIGDEGTSDLSHPGFLALPKTVVSKAIEVHYPRHLQCHLGRTTQMGPDIPDEAGGIEKRCV